MKIKHGISLIVLVITIIVIGVLSTAVILSISNNNPIDNAKKTVFLNDIRTIEEDISVYISSDSEEDFEDETNLSVSGKDMVLKLPSTKNYEEKIMIVNGKIVLTDKATDKEKEWASQINIFSTVWDGVTKDTAWYDYNKNETEFEISTSVELAGFAKLVNEDGETFEGKTVNLVNDINLNNDEWEPIGNNNASAKFSGVFDGNGHKISNIEITESSNTGGLFGYVLDGSIKNITVCDSTLEGTYVASIAKDVERGTIENCHSFGNSIKGSCSAAGIVCNNIDGGKIINCSNTSRIECTATKDSSEYGAGGIVAGGIDGYMGFRIAKISNCFNSGEIISNIHAGGIVSRLWSSDIENCYNVGKVSAESYAGGIIGDLYINDISNCYNVGEISGEEDKTGEIVGYASAEGAIGNCYYLSGKDALGGAYGPEDPEYVEGDPYFEDFDAHSTTVSSMKKLSFVNNLNNGSTSFKQDTNNINNGFPILSWQK